MRRILSTLTMLCFISVCHAYEISYQGSDSLKVLKLLDDARSMPDNTNYIVYFARQLKGIPYVAHTLEINKKEKLVVNLRQLDCTTYIENVLSLYLCVKQKKYTFRDFCHNLRMIRYRDGAEPHYTARLHYFTEWIENNTKKGICKEVQAPTPPFKGIQKVNVYYMSANPHKYKMLKENPEYVPAIAMTEEKINKKSYKYIPEKEIKNSVALRKIIHDGDIIATTTTIKGLDIQHLGFAIWHDDGLHMLNASSLRKKVVEEPQTLYKYMLGQKSMNGIRIVRVLQP